MKPTERTADIIQRRTAGETLASIGKIHGISREYVRQVCKKSGLVPSHSRPPTPIEKIQEAVSLLRSGKTREEAATAIGIDISTLNIRAKTFGVDLKVPTLEGRTHRYDGKTWGMWTAIDGGYDYQSPNQRWQLCRCECGVERQVMVGNLQSGVSRGCGCRNSKEGGRERIPWVCSATGERFENSMALAKHLGVNNLIVYRRLCRGENYIDANGQEWIPLPAEKTVHRPDESHKEILRGIHSIPVVCDETGETWPSIKVAAQSIGISHTRLRECLATRPHYSRDGRTYRKEAA